MNNNSNKLFLDIKTETIIKLVFIAGILMAFWHIRNIIVVILTAVVIASFVEGAVQRFSLKSVNRSVKVVLVYVTMFFLFGGVLYLLLPTFIREVAGLVSLIPGDSQAGMILQNIAQPSDVNNGVSEINSTNIAGQLQNAYQTFSSNFFNSLSSLFGGIVNVVLIVVISFYLSIQEKGIENFLKIITPLNHEKKVLSIWFKIQKKIGLWFQGQLLMAFIVAVLTYIGLLIVGAPYALLLALLTGVAELVPFGLIFATLPAMVLAFKAGGVSLALFVLIVYVVVQQLENYLLQPTIVERTTGVPSLIVLLSVIIGISVFGVYGLFLGIPFAVLILELINEHEAIKLKNK